MKNLKMIILLSFVFIGHLSALQDSTKQNDLSQGLKFFNQSTYQYFGDSTNQFHSDIDSAIHYMKLAYPYLRKEKNWEKYIECFSALSWFYHTNNDFDSSKNYAELAFTEAEKYLEPNNLKFGDIFNNLNAIYSRIGNNRKGISLLNKSLEIRKQNKESDFQLSFAYQNLGTAYSRLGDTKKAIEYLSHSIKLRLESDSIPEHDILFAESYNIFANVYRLVEDFENSIFYYKKSLKILNHEDCQKNQLALNLRVLALIDISEMLIRTNQYERSRPYLNRIFELHDNGVQIQFPTSLYLRALLNFKNKKFETALKDIKNSNLVSDKDNNENSPPLIAKRFKLWGDILQSQNKLDSAIHVYNKGLSILGISEYKNLNDDLDLKSTLAKPEALNLMLGISKCLKSKAIVNNTKESWLNSFNNYLSAVRLIKEMRSGIETVESKNTLASKAMEIYEQALDAAYNVLKFGKDEVVLNHVFEIIESNKALLLLEAYNRQLALGSLDIPKEMIDLEYDLKVDLAYYEKEISLEYKKDETSDDKIKNLKLSLQLTNQKYDSLIYYINTINPDFNRYKNEINLTDINQLKATLLKDKSTALEYFQGPDWLFLMIINGENIEFLKLETENLADHIDNLKEQLSIEASLMAGNEGFEKFSTSSTALFDQLFKPALPFIDNRNENIIIIPDGYIASIPFDILTYGTNEEVAKGYSINYLDYLLEKYNISYSYSSTLLANGRKIKKKNSKLGLVAFAPSFESKSVSQQRVCECDGIQLQNLRCNQQEGTLIADMYSGHLYQSNEADKASFLKNANQYEIIHIASHACIDQNDGQLNQIFFHDGGISNYELNTANLNNELTVLSACNTGIGKIQNGEGVLNIAKGFLMAGSKSVLMSLWAVNDCTTSKLMQSYYSNLKKGESRNNAIRKAKIEFLTEANRLHSHPYYWGAFVHFGKTEPINVNNYNSYFWAFSLFAFLCILAFYGYRKSKK